MKLEIKEKVKEIISDLLGIENIEQIYDESNFSADLGADSLDAVEIIMQVEGFFDIHIPNEEAETIFTVISLIEIVEKKIKEKED
jgi:acyl carrier protein